jgi:DNA repair ATPase RecN
MDKKDLRDFGEVVDRKLNQNIKPLKKEFDKVNDKLNVLEEKVDSNTAAVMNIEREIKTYMDALDIERKRIDKHDKRLEVIEESLNSNLSL